MKKGDTVKYVGEDTDKLKNQTGTVIRKIRRCDKELWEVNFGNGIGIHPALEENLTIVSRQFQLLLPFMD
jgi:hypothetical protein